MADTRNRPIPFADVERVFKPREAIKPSPLKVERRFHVAADRAPEVRTRVERIERANGYPHFEVVVEVDGVRTGARGLPAPLKGQGLKRGERRLFDRADEKLLNGFLPDHLGFSPFPLQRARPVKTLRPVDGRKRIPTTVFSPDDRRLFRDTAYPWSTIGKVETNRGWASGVMIGPRHMVTVSHIIDWDAPDGFAADWVRFTPSEFDGDAPFGEAYGVHIYWFVQEDGDGSISADEALHDYAVVVLDRRLGETTGWMGARAYDDDWDSLAAWSHMGYPGDLNSGQRPSWQGGFRVDGTDAAAQAILHQADVFPGQSGGPIFGFWDGDAGPRAVAVQSWQNEITNGASGSHDMRDLIARARSEFA